MQSVIENPANADAWVPTVQPPNLDEVAMHALIEAEQTVKALEERAAAMLENLSLLTGRAAGLAATAAKIAAPPVPVLVATDAVTAAAYHELEAMKAADPNSARTRTIEITHGDGVHGVVVPDSWKAKRAAMSTLGITATVHQESAAAPRWVAEMHLPGGAVVRGADNGAGMFTQPDSYLFPTPRCAGRR